MDHDEVFEDTWKNQPDEWLDFVKNRCFVYYVLLY